METFEGERANAACQRWAAAHPNGYVLNSYIPPTTTYLVLHRADCFTLLAAMAADKSMTRQYAKRCSLDRSDLDRYARRLGGRVRPCEHCLGH